MDLYEELRKLINILNIKQDEYKRAGIEYAKAYKNYRILLAKELLKLKSEKVPVTIAYDIARGEINIANAKEQEIISECIYKACQESINCYKLQIKILQEQINKEYHN